MVLVSSSLEPWAPLLVLPLSSPVISGKISSPLLASVSSSDNEGTKLANLSGSSQL